MLGKETVPLLRSKFKEIKDFRNDVMHAHSMNTVSFHAAFSLIKDTNKQLDIEINKTTDTKKTSSVKQAGVSFNTILEDAIKNMDAPKGIQEYINGLQATIAQHIDLDGIAAISEAYKQQLCIDPHILSGFKHLQEKSQVVSIPEDAIPVLKLDPGVKDALIKCNNTTNGCKQKK